MYSRTHTGVTRPTKSVHRIEERGSNPPGKTRFTRSTSNITAEQQAAQQGSLTDAEMCRQMLCDGFVQSYVDFYHLMHRSDPVPLDRNDVIFIRNHIVRAEESRRRGNTKGVHQSYMKLATLYLKFNDYKTSIFFYEKCYELAQMTSDKLAEMAANHCLGTVYQKMVDIETARRFHERHEDLAKAVENAEEVTKANIELYKVYFILAHRMDDEDNYDEALELYSKCLLASRLSMDKAAEAEANGKVGNILMRKGEMAAAIPFLREYSQIASDLDDAENRCHASSALAAALDSLGMTEKALVELQLVSSISEQAGDTMLQSQACLALGKLASKIGKFDEAYEALQRHFDLLKSISVRATVAGNKEKNSKDTQQTVGSKELDSARVFLGISRGNRLMKAYITAIDYDLSSLLDWKLTRNDHMSVP